MKRWWGITTSFKNFDQIGRLVSYLLQNIPSSQTTTKIFNFNSFPPFFFDLDIHYFHYTVEQKPVQIRHPSLSLSHPAHATIPSQQISLSPQPTSYTTAKGSNCCLGHYQHFKFPIAIKHHSNFPPPITHITQTPPTNQ